MLVLNIKTKLADTLVIGIAVDSPHFWLLSAKARTCIVKPAYRQVGSTLLR